MLDIQYIKENNLLLFECVRGSHVYGTNIETSDIDKIGVFISPLNNIFGFNYIEQVSDEKNDFVYYELKKFLELITSNNPNILEVLNTPEEFVTFKHPLFEEIIKQKDKFITKKCKDSFLRYCQSQIIKAKGLNKKQNWERQRIERKTVLDFCYVPEEKSVGSAIIQGQGSMPVKEWLSLRGLSQQNCGLVSLSNMRYTYSLFYDETNEKQYRGLVSDESIANDISLSSIPDKNAIPLTVMQFNKDFYSVHCKEYREYQEWLKKRNVQRYVDVKNHNQMIDGKNMLHCVRLLNMSREIAEEKGVIVRRPNAKELLKIRKGEVDLQSIIDWAQKESEEIAVIFDNSNLPDDVEEKFVEELLIDIRRKFYNIK
jgi:predicted nucleotidyltransferase